MIPNPFKPYLYVALSLLIISSIGYVFWLHKDRDKFEATAKLEKSEKDKAIQTINTIQQEAERSRKISEGYQSAKTKIEYVDRIVTKDIIRYRERVVNRCELSPSWVQIHNASTDSVYTESSSDRADESASGAAEAAK